MNNIGPIADMTMSTQTPEAPECNNVAVEAHQPGQAELPGEAKIQGPLPTNVTQKKTERISIKKQVGMRSSKRVKAASFILVLFSLAIIGASFIMSYAPMLSLMLSLGGISVFLISILFYFVTPQKLVRSDVCDAEAISSTELINTLLAPIAGDSKSIYVPSSYKGTTKVFIRTNNSDLSKAYHDGDDIKNVRVSGMGGIFITPPGYGLLTYAKSLGATFTDEGLEDEITDVLVNGTELASRVEVKRKADSVCVRINDLADSLMCKTIRQKNPTACCQVGCPMCSFVACMVAEGTGKLAIINDVKPDGKALDITYRLL
jgi:hypothetical protein